MPCARDEELSNTVKGVNKQIVEINCTNDDYVEKAILILNPAKSNLPGEMLQQKADAYLQTLLPKSRVKRPDRLLHIGLFLSTGIAIALSIALAILLL